MNPLLADEALPLFDEIQPSHVVPAMKERIAEAHKALDDIEASLEPTWVGLVERLERISERVSVPWGAVGHLMSVRNSPELRKAYEAVQSEVVELSTRFGQSKPVYLALCAILDGEEFSLLDATQRRILNLMIRDAELSGVALEGEAKKRYNEIAVELSKLQTDFSNRVLDATKAWSKTLDEARDVEGLPKSALQMLAASSVATGSEQGSAEAGPWTLTLALPNFLAFMKHSPRRALREELYRAFVTKASSGETDNTQTMLDILRLRREKAGILGFSSFAELSLVRKMATDVAAVDTLIEELLGATLGAAVREVEELRKHAASAGAEEAHDFRPWDFHFWSERLREAKFDYTEEEVRQYFPMDRVLGGLFSLVSDLFSVTVRKAAQAPSLWHQDVEFYEVLDGSGAVVAAFYLDPYARPAEKRGGAWMNDVVGRSRAFAPPGSDIRIPVCHVVCNGTPPLGGTRSTMTFQEVETLFHEFGHALQHMLTRVDHVQAAGINNVEWDAVELPSQFMENWVYLEDVLIGLSEHVTTGERLPKALFEKIRAGRTFLAGFSMLRQLNFAMTDIELHHRFDPESGRTPYEVHEAVSKKTTVIEPIAEDRFLNSFGHIFAGGYAAGYYSYKWAEVLSADAFAAFEEAGLDDDGARRRVGQEFRETVLALGGSKPAMEVFEAFRGRAPKTEALLKHNGLLAV